MPRLTCSVPRYRKHRGSDQAFVELNGRRIYLGPHGTKASKLEYDRLVAEWLVNGRQIVPQAAQLTVVELIVAYLRYCEGYYRKDGRPTSESHDIALSLRPVHALYSRTPCCEFGPTALKAVRQKMVEDGLARTVINQRIGRVKRMFKWGASSELIPATIHVALETVEGLKAGRTEAHETSPVQPVADYIIDATLPYLPSVVADMVRFQRLTGCRPAEVCAIRPSDVDRSGDVWTYTPQSHKTEHHGRSRVIAIGPQAQAVLLRYMVRDAQAYCFRPCDSEEKRLAERHAARKTPLSCGNRPGTNRKRGIRSAAGDRYDTHAYYRAIRRACDLAFPAPGELGRRPSESDERRLARLDDSQRMILAKWQAEHRWSPLQLRHSAATEIRQRFGLEAAQVALGHAHARVSEVYAERDLQKAIEVARRIG